MSLIPTTTTAINTDEACLNLSEMNLRRPDSKGFDRYMIVTVVRDDKPVDFWIDLGPASGFAVEEFRIPGGAVDPHSGKLWSVHNVGELVEIANNLRERPREQTEPQTPNLIQAFLDQPDVRQRVKKKVSSFGFAGAIQRS